MIHFSKKTLFLSLTALAFSCGGALNAGERKLDRSRLTSPYTEPQSFGELLAEETTLEESPESEDLMKTEPIHNIPTKEPSPPETNRPTETPEQ